MKKPIEQKQITWGQSETAASSRSKKIEQERTVWNQTEKPTSSRSNKIEPNVPSWGGSNTPTPSRLKQVEMQTPSWGAGSSTDKVIRKTKAEFRESQWAQPLNTDVKVEKKPMQVGNEGWNEISGIQSPQVIRSFKGINGMEPFSISEEYATHSKNLDSAKFPALTTRQGVLTYSAFDIGEYGTNGFRAAIDGLTSWKDRLVASSHGQYYIESQSVFVKTGPEDKGANFNISSTQFKGNFDDIYWIGTNGVGSVYKLKMGSAPTVLANAPEDLNYICSHDNRIYGAVGNKLHFSALSKAEDWTTLNDAGEIVVDDGYGDITGLVPSNGRLIIFKEDSMYELYGTGPRNFELQPVSETIGCTSHHTAVMVDGILYFLSKRGVYRYDSVGTPTKDFSLPIQHIASDLSSWDYQSLAETDGTNYYLAVPYGDTKARPNIILVYNTIYETWNIHEFPAKEEVRALCYHEEKMYIGFDDGTVGAYLDFMDEDDNDPIEYDWISKPLSRTSLSAENNWYKAWVVVDVPFGSTMEVQVSTTADRVDDWISVKNIPAEVDIQSESIIIPFNQYANNAHWLRFRIKGTGPVTLYEVATQERTLPFGQG